MNFLSTILTKWQGLIFVIGTWIAAFLGSYLTQKAKNTATKEDISEITKKVEDIKIQSHINKQNVLTFKEQQEKILLQFNNRVISFLYDKLSVNFGDFPLDNGKSLFDFRKSFTKEVIESIKSFQLLIIYFFEESKILTESTNLVELIKKANIIFRQHFINIKTTIIQEETAWKTGKDLDIAINNSNKVSQLYLNDIQIVLDEYKKTMDRFIIELNNFLKPKI